MGTDWQTLVAGAVVVLTLLVFLIRLARPRRGGGCGHGCDCGRKPEHRK
jgi:hypothetical protein